MRKYRRFGRLSEFEDMALIGVLTTQLLIHQFVQHFDHSVPEVEPVRICQGEELHR
jgi:hypothetical protein